MPKARVDTSVEVEGNEKVITFPVGQPGDKPDKPATYRFPVDFAGLAEMVISATDDVAEGQKRQKHYFGEKRDGQNESFQAFLYRVFNDSFRSIARNMVYEQEAQESTLVTIGGKKYDIMELPEDDLVVAINNYNVQYRMRLSMAKLDESNPAHADQVDAVAKGIGLGPYRAAAKKKVEEGRFKLVGKAYEIVS